MILGIALVHAVLMTIFVADLVSRQKNFLRTQSLEQTEALARSLAANSVSWVLADDVIGLEEIVTSLKTYPNLEYAMILSPEGRVLGHTNSNHVGRYVLDNVSISLLKGDEPRYLVNDNRLLDVGVPVLRAGDLIGWARVAISQKVLHGSLRTILRDGVGYTVLAILVGSVFAVAMASSITSGIRQLLQGTRQVEAGRTDIRVKDDRVDELGQLGRSFNKMVETIRQSIADLNRAREKALKEKEKAQAYLNTAMVAVLVLDLKGNILLVNPHCLNILKYRQGDILGRNWFETCIPEDTAKERHDKYLASLKALDTKYLQFESRVATRDNDIRIMDWRNTFLRDPEGNLSGMMRSGIDITQRKQAENALKKSEKQFQDLFNSINDLIYTQNTEGRFISVNPAMSKLFGYGPEEFKKLRPTHFMAPGARENFQSQYLDIISDQGQCSGIAAYRKKNKEKIYIEYKSSLVTPPGSAPYISGIGRDVTEKILSEKKLKKLQRQVLQSQKMEAIGTLAGGIAHDFNNILFPILGYTEMLMEDTPKDNPVYDRLEKIYSGGLRAKELVQQILTFSRMDKNKLQEIEIQPVIEEVLKLIRSSIPKTIDIRHDVSADCGIVKADATQIHQIVMNLITNAYHAIGEDTGEIRVSLREVTVGEYDVVSPDMEPGAYACLKIIDTGVGISKDRTEKIFDPFYTTKGKGKGTGMGLSVVHGIVAGMGGGIQVYSEPGEGSEFSVFLPVAGPIAGEEAAIVRDSLEEGDGHILVIDDEEAIISMEREMLERLGYQVTGFASSKKALEHFRKNPGEYDLVITDLAMPSLPGDKLVPELLKIRPDLPVLLSTGFTASMSAKTMETIGVRDILLKPVMMNDLAQKVISLLDRGQKEGSV